MFSSHFVVDDRGSVHVPDIGFTRLADVDDEIRSRILDRGHFDWVVTTGYVKIRLRPSVISEEAYVRLLGWLASTKPQRLMLSLYVQGGWHYEFFRDPQDALRRVQLLVEHYGGGTHCNLRSRSRTISQLLSKSAWSAAINYWQHTRDAFSPGDATAIFDAIFDRQWILYATNELKSFRVHSFGAKHAPHVHNFLRKGRLLKQSTPSLLLERSVQRWQEAISVFEPRGEEIELVAHWPGFGRRKSQFRRITLPFRSNETSFVLSGLASDATIDLLG